MADRRMAIVLGSAALVVAGATILAANRIVASRREAAWQPPPASGVIPPPPLGGPPPATGAAAAPRVLRVDSSGCTPVEERNADGAMSLDSVARARGVPIDILIRGLHLPAGVPRAAPLRILMRTHAFTLRDVDRVVTDYLKHC